jgi:FkbM family methyltransferase
LYLVNDWLEDLSHAIDVIPEGRRKTAIQAGGAMGLWPYEMAQYFDRVYTFEPEQTNYECLCENVKGKANVFPIHGALGDHDGFVEVKLPPQELGNAGAFYVMPILQGVTEDAHTPLFTIDMLVERNEIKGEVGLIQLDVEGRELEVLKGAFDTIAADAPVIMVEDKPLPQDKETGHRYGAVERYLIDELKYKLHMKVHRDLIFVPGGV